MAPLRVVSGYVAAAETALKKEEELTRSKSHVSHSHHAVHDLAILL